MCLLSGCQSNARESENSIYPFSINGTVNVDTGAVVLNLPYDTSYYPENVEKMMTTVQNGKFSFEGRIPYPMGFMLTVGQGYRSRLFIVEPGAQTVSVDVSARGEVPKVTNTAMREYEEAYSKAQQPTQERLKRYSARRDGLRQLHNDEVPDSIQLSLERDIKAIYTQSDSILLAYATTHSESYTAFWKLIEIFNFDGYQTVYDSTFNQFSDSLKRTYTGQVLRDRLNAASITALGKKFPKVVVVDHRGEQLDNVTFLANEYTFIDFWYSNCSPCIRQFPHLRKIYATY
ncbi:MAG: DUF4369 domain-containing protein [Bacteroidota bacterium]